MPIQTECPFCHRQYRLRDDLLGKRVTCANPECRKTFQVTVPVPAGTRTSASANGAATTKTVAPAPAVAAPAAAPKPLKPAPEETVPAKPAAKKHEETKHVEKKPAKKPEEPKPAEKKPEEQVPDVDAEALAASLFSDEGATKTAEPEDQRTIEMICISCDHKWQVPWAMQGKKVLCPECKQIQKVPVQQKEKKIDWRDPNANRPTLAKGEDVPNDVALQTTKAVSNKTLLEAGVIEGPTVEPRPLKQKVFFGVAVGALVMLLVIGGVFFFRNRSEKREEQFMPQALKFAGELTEADLPKTQAPLVKAIIDIAAGEHAARSSKDKAKRDEALRHFAAARTELEGAAKSLEREFLLMELAFAQLSLGGTDEQALAESHLRWVPAQAQTNKPRINADITSVQAELRRVLVLLRRDGQGANFELRALLVRKLGVELVKRGQPDLLEEIVAQGFKDAELPEALAELALEYHRANLVPAKVKALAEQVKSLLAGNPLPQEPAPTSVVVLWQQLDLPAKDLPTIASAPGTGDVTQATRMAYATLNAFKDTPDEAAALIKKTGSFADKLRAAALAAEFAKTPAAILAVAAEIATNEKTVEIRKSATTSLARLALVAARANDPNTANTILGTIPDEGTQLWLTAEVNRLQMQTNTKQKPNLANLLKVEPGQEPKAGHAWSAYTMARQHGLATEEAKDQFSSWGKVQHAMGLAGLALGLQDAKLK